MKSTLTGLIAAPHTPFRADGALDLSVVPRQATLLARNGVTGAFICGTTGEGHSLTVSERQQVASAWRSATPTGLQLIVHVGHLCLAESCALARHAAEIGADAIATIAPSFFKPTGVAELVEYCRQIAAAAPQLPFYYYHMPAMTGVSIPVAEFLPAAARVIPTLAGIKFTHEDLFDYGRSSEFEKGRYTMLFGRDEILLAGLSLGATGAVGSTYNYASPLFLNLMKAFAAGDIATARREQARAREFITVLNQYGGLAAGKAAMKLIGVDCGPVRLPLRQLTSSQEQSLRQGLDEIGFFTYCSQVA
ncbi:MAG TPA: dihydrodipicolinate synthase family protein [Opitutaceae bacterium]|nr:dihydrodipicolinate synthase family protein [Opitutaceae bacterium]